MILRPAFLQRKIRCALAAVLVVSSAWAQAVPASDGPGWAELTTSQRATLTPLEKDWAQLPASTRRKWVEVANRLPSMPAAQQQRVNERMQEWAKLSPAQRGEARFNFQLTQQLPGAEKQARWEAYQALTPEQRAALAAKAAPASAPASANVAGLHKAPLSAQAPKSNVVRPPEQAAPPAPKPVAPTLVQAGPGATTRLVTAARPAPPAHQQAGMPKIVASPGMVDRATLLPKRGPQAAAALPASGAPMAVTMPGLPASSPAH